MSNSIIMYHGTRASNPEAIMEDPRAQASINGMGFYCTNDIEVARHYGSTVIAYEVSREIMATMSPVVRPIDQRYNDPSMDISISECAQGGMEYVFTQRDATNMVIEAEDYYIV